MRALNVPIAAALVSLAALVAAAADLASYTSPPVPASKMGIVFSIGYPSGWEQVWGGERTRFYPPASSEGPKSALTYIHVDVFSREDGGVDSALNQKKNALEGWLAITRPRYEIEDRRRPKVGSRGDPCEAILAKDPAHDYQPDRRELFVLVPAGDVNFVVRLSAPLAEYAGREAIWKQVLASFDPAGG